jgi:dTDP-4-dehydrorhamnose 3,5-epimerase
MTDLGSAHSATASAGTPHGEAALKQVANAHRIRRYLTNHWPSSWTGGKPRTGSPRPLTYARWIEMHLSEDNFAQCLTRCGFAHAFSALSEIAEIEYKCTDFYDPGDELRIVWRSGNQCALYGL